jgi:hypothetical protein
MIYVNANGKPIDRAGHEHPVARLKRTTRAGHVNVS